MKKINKIFTGLMFLGAALVMFSSCNKKKTDPEKTLQLEGEWKFQSINFLDESTIHWDSTVEYSYANQFGYAPFMWGGIGMKGMSFEDKMVKDDLGHRFVFLYDGNHGEDMSLDYWYWNYLDNKKSFEIGQINSQMPPFDYSIMDVSNIRQNDDGTQITFEAKMYSRRVGGAVKDIIKVPVEIVIEKGVGTKYVDILVEGKPYVAPEGNQTGNPSDTTTRGLLMNTHWKLKAGSDVYDPGMVAQDSTKEYMKLVAFNLIANDTLRYRYSFPMGIVSAKKYAQDALDQHILKTLMGDGTNSPIQVIEWQVLSIDKKNTKEMTLKEKKSGMVRTFVLIDDIATDVNKDDYNIVGN